MPVALASARRNRQPKAARELCRATLGRTAGVLRFHSSLEGLTDKGALCSGNSVSSFIQTRLSSGSSSRRHFVERERKTRRAIAAGERDMLAQHTDESFRADDVSFRNAGGAVVQVLMRSDFFATEAFFCDHGRHPFLEQRRGSGDCA